MDLPVVFLNQLRDRISWSSLFNKLTHAFPETFTFRHVNCIAHLGILQCYAVYGAATQVSFRSKITPREQQQWIEWKIAEPVGKPGKLKYNVLRGGGAKVQVTGHRSGHRLQATGHRPQVRLQATGHSPQIRSQVTQKTIVHWTKLFWTDVLLYKNNSYGISKLRNEITKVCKIMWFVRKTNHMFFTENEVLSCY